MGVSRNIGEANAIAKLTKDKVLDMRRLYATDKYTLKRLAELFDVSYTTAQRATNYNSWKHVA